MGFNDVDTVTTGIIEHALRPHRSPANAETIQRKSIRDYAAARKGETLLRKECLDTVGNERTQALVRSRLFFVDICLGIF